MDIVTIKTFFDPVAAELAKMRLETEGILCFLADQNAAAMPSVFGTGVGIRLQVMEKDVEIAASIIAAPEETLDTLDTSSISSESTADASAAPRETPIDFSDTAPPPLEEQSEETVFSCPKCHSDRIDRERITSFSKLLITLLFIGLPLLFLTPTHTCRKCGHTW